MVNTCSASAADVSIGGKGGDGENLFGDDAQPGQTGPLGAAGKGQAGRRAWSCASVGTGHGGDDGAPGGAGAGASGLGTISAAGYAGPSGAREHQEYQAKAAGGGGGAKGGLTICSGARGAGASGGSGGPGGCGWAARRRRWSRRFQSRARQRRRDGNARRLHADERSRWCSVGWAAPLNLAQAAHRAVSPDMGKEAPAMHAAAAPEAVAAMGDPAEEASVATRSAIAFTGATPAQTGGKVTPGHQRHWRHWSRWKCGRRRRGAIVAGVFNERSFSILGTLAVRREWRDPPIESPIGGSIVGRRRAER